jgi:NAD(P)-dependent dehydrogenase (short-subunit alcohol dehydrogenase family)
MARETVSIISGGHRGWVVGLGLAVAEEAASQGADVVIAAMRS